MAKAITFRTERPEFICFECGKCCRHPVADENFHWNGGTLTWEETQFLLAKSKELPFIKDACLMFYFENSKGRCLIENELGEEKRDKVCRLYPGIELCKREQDLKEKENG